MVDNKQSEVLLRGLIALSENSFPKRCANCGAVYASVEDYVKKTKAIDGRSGLKRSYDDDDNPIVQLFRNCVCGSTLMDCFNNRRDISKTGAMRRALFDDLIRTLMGVGLQESYAREQLLKVLKGERSKDLENWVSTPRFNDGGGHDMDRRRDIVSALQKGMIETVSFFNSLTPEQLQTRIYQDGAHWTAQQVTAHLITIERSMQRLFDNILSGGPGASDDFDIDRFNLSQTKKKEGLDLQTLIAQFTAVRQQTIAMVEKMTEQDLDREGHHPFHGRGKLERFIRWAYEHARIHEDEIGKVLNPLQGSNSHG